MKPVKLRFAEPADWPAIQALHIEHQRRQGTNYELPYLFAPYIAVALVGIDDQGTIRNCIYVEKTAELRFVGCDAKATALSWREAHGLGYVLKAMGFRWLECFVPRKMKAMIEKPLHKAGFECVDDDLAHFSKDLRG